MSETIPGGRYLSADGKTWHDANGKPVPAPAGFQQVLPEAPVEVQPEPEPTPEAPKPDTEKAAKAGRKVAKE